MRAFGRLLQFAGLVLLPVSIYMEATNLLSRDSGVSDMVIMMVAGVAAFTIGRIVEGYAPS